MPEEYEVSTDRVQELINEKREAGLMESRPRWIDLLAVSTALFAVLAAVAALHAGDKANESLLTVNRAVLMAGSPSWWRSRRSRPGLGICVATACPRRGG